MFSITSEPPRTLRASRNRGARSSLDFAADLEAQLDHLEAAHRRSWRVARAFLYARARARPRALRAPFSAILLFIVLNHFSCFARDEDLHICLGSVLFGFLLWLFWGPRLFWETRLPQSCPLFAFHAGAISDHSPFGCQVRQSFLLSGVTRGTCHDISLYSLCPASTILQSASCKCSGKCVSLRI